MYRQDPLTTQRTTKDPCFLGECNLKIVLQNKEMS